MINCYMFIDKLQFRKFLFEWQFCNNFGERCWFQLQALVIDKPESIYFHNVVLLFTWIISNFFFVSNASYDAHGWPQSTIRSLYGNGERLIYSTPLRLFCCYLNTSPKSILLVMKEIAYSGHWAGTFYTGRQWCHCSVIGLPRLTGSHKPTIRKNDNAEK